MRTYVHVHAWLSRVIGRLIFMAGSQRTSRFVKEHPREYFNMNFTWDCVMQDYLSQWLRLCRLREGPSWSNIFSKPEEQLKIWSVQYFRMPLRKRSFTQDLLTQQQGEVLKVGFLRKKGHVRRNWLDRWFVLTTEGVYYYKNRLVRHYFVWSNGITQKSVCNTTHGKATMKQQIFSASAAQVWLVNNPYLHVLLLWCVAIRKTSYISFQSNLCFPMSLYLIGRLLVNVKLYGLGSYQWLLCLTCK